jgi:hypothetical protein
MLNFNDLNYLAIIVSALLSFGLGVVWYTILFGKIWEKEVNLSKEQLEKPNYLKTYGGSFVLIVLMMFALAVVLKNTGITKDSQWIDAGKTGLGLGVLLVASSIGINYLYQYKSLKLFLIDAGYQTFFLTLGAILLAIWN